MGNKADVSGNDLLQYWDDDAETDVILLYLESFGNPRKFARLARARESTQADRGREGRPDDRRGRGPTSSHTAALAAPDVAVDALFRQAGVIRVDTIDELFDVGTLLRYQPLPAGRRNSTPAATKARHSVSISSRAPRRTNRIAKKPFSRKIWFAERCARRKRPARTAARGPI